MRLVGQFYDKLTPSEELLILLHNHYGKMLTEAEVYSSLNRRDSKPIKNGLSALWRRKLIDGSPMEGGYVLTTKGFDEALKVINKHQKKK